MKEALMTITLTPLGYCALRECVDVFIEACNEFSPDDNPVQKLTKSKLMLDLATVEKQKYATYLAAALETMPVEPGLGWETKRRKDACSHLATKIDNAVTAAMNEVGPPPDPLPEAGQAAAAVPDDQLVPATEPEDRHPVTPAPEPTPSAEGHHLSIPVAGDEVMTSATAPAISVCGEVATLDPPPAIPVAGDEVMTAVAQHPETGTALSVREIETYLTDCIQMDSIYPLPLALWVCFTHCWESSPVCPQVMNSTATSLSGKTALLEILSYASDRPYLRIHFTKSALYHQITEQHSTIF
jgi:hypothetical protein